MKEALDLAVQWYQSYIGVGFYHILYLICLIWLIRDRRIERKWKYFFVGYTILFLFLYYFPVTAKVIITLIGEDVYWRMFWILPVPVFVAFMAAWVVDERCAACSVRGCCCPCSCAFRTEPVYERRICPGRKLPKTHGRNDYGL